MSKIKLYFNSSESGSIFEISKDLSDVLKEHFDLTADWQGDEPEESDREILLSHFVRPEVVFNPIFNTFKFKVLIQPIDGTVLVSEAIFCINQYDLIIVPAQASKRILETNGITKPIVIIPNYYKSDLYEKEIYSDVLKEIPQDKIVFYHESTFHPRKGIELLYEGFIKAFSGDKDIANQVCLVVKDLPYNFHSLQRIERFKKQAIKLQKKYKYPATIYKYSCFLEPEELKQLWNRANIYVSLAKIEGFGIPMLRMHLMNKPIICLDNHNSGYMDYLNHNNSYLIPTIQHTAKDEFMWLYNEKTEWAIPNISEVVRMFRYCYNDYIKGQYKSISNSYLGQYIEQGTYNDLMPKLHQYSFKTVSTLYIETIIKHYTNFISKDKESN